jgi:exonuclease I
MIDGGRAYNWPVVGCGCAAEADSLGCVFDLRFDPEDFLQFSEDELVSVMRSQRKALRYVAANKQPILLPIDFARDLRCGINVKDGLILSRANIVANEEGFRRRACRALARRFEREGEPAEYVEDRIYDQFPSFSDQQLMRSFHLVPWEQRISIVILTAVYHMLRDGTFFSLPRTGPLCSL